MGLFQFVQLPLRVVYLIVDLKFFYSKVTVIFSDIESALIDIDDVITIESTKQEHNPKIKILIDITKNINLKCNKY